MNKVRITHSALVSGTTLYVDDRHWEALKTLTSNGLLAFVHTESSREFVPIAEAYGIESGLIGN